MSSILFFTKYCQDGGSDIERQVKKHVYSRQEKPLSSVSLMSRVSKTRTRNFISGGGAGVVIVSPSNRLCDTPSLLCSTYPVGPPPPPPPGVKAPKYDATHVLPVSAKFKKDWSCTSIIKPKYLLGVLPVLTCLLKDKLMDIAAVVALCFYMLFLCVFCMLQQHEVSVSVSLTNVHTDRV